MNIRPTTGFTPFSGAVEVLNFGRASGNWSLRNAPGSDEPPKEISQKILATAEDFRVKKLFAPRPTLMNAEICQKKDLTKGIGVDATYKIWRGKDADGVVLTEPGDAFFVSSADCITIVAFAKSPSGEPVLVASHAGRESLYDRNEILGHEPRFAETVVLNMLGQLTSLRISPDSVQVFLTCGIYAENFSHPFDHPDYGETNMKMVQALNRWGHTCVLGNSHQHQKDIGQWRHGKISLSEVIRHQLIHYGVLPHQIGHDTSDTYSSQDNKGEYKWWSCRRARELNLGQEEQLSRNGVFVILRE